MGWLFAAGAAAVAAAWWGYRRRIRKLRDGSLSDGDVRMIERSGRLEADEPLDLEEAAQEEDRFWGESWDEPERF